MSDKPTTSAPAPLTKQVRRIEGPYSYHQLTYSQGRHIDKTDKLVRDFYYRLCFHMFEAAPRAFPITMKERSRSFDVWVGDILIYRYHMRYGAPFVAMWTIMSLQKQTPGQFRSDILYGFAVFETALQFLCERHAMFFPNATEGEICHMARQIFGKYSSILIDIIHSLAIYECVLLTKPKLVQGFTRDLANSEDEKYRIFLQYIDIDTDVGAVRQIAVRPLSTQTNVVPDISDQIPGSRINLLAEYINKYIDDEAIMRMERFGPSVIINIPYTYKLFKLRPSCWVLNHLPPDSRASIPKILPVSHILTLLGLLQKKYRLTIEERNPPAISTTKFKRIPISAEYALRQIFGVFMAEIKADPGHVREDMNDIFATIEYIGQVLSDTDDDHAYIYLSAYADFYSEIQTLISQMTYVEWIVKTLTNSANIGLRRFAGGLNTTTPNYGIAVRHNFKDYTIEVQNTVNLYQTINNIAKMMEIRISDGTHFKIWQNLSDYIYDQTRQPVVFGSTTYYPRTPFVLWPASCPASPSVSLLFPASAFSPAPSPSK